MSLASVSDLLRQALRELDAMNTAPGILVRAGDNLLSVLELAPAGAVVTVDPDFVLDADDIAITAPVTLVSSRALGPARVDAALVGPTLRGALTLGPNVTLRGFRLEGLRADNTIVTTGPLTILDRCAVVGTAQGQHRGVRADSAGVSILGCAIVNIWAVADAQAIAAWDGCAQLLVDDCLLEASGENVMFGGADSASAATMPHDILIDRCTLTKPLTWKGQAGLAAKNLFEVKCAQRLTLRRSTLAHSWVNAQTGYGLVLTVKNQDGGAPWSTIEDVTIEDNTVDDCVSGVQVLGRDYAYPSGVMDRVTLQRNVFTGLNGGTQLIISSGPHHLTLADNTFAGVNLNTIMLFDRPAFLCDGLRVTGNSFLEGEYGIHGTDAPALGQAVLDMYAPGYVWEKNTITRGASGRFIQYPPGTTVL